MPICLIITQHRNRCEITHLSCNLSIALIKKYISRYLEHAYHFPRWEMTDSEILGGIDGLYLAHKIPSFTTSTNRLKLSQVLDMYYSKRGLPFVMIENTNTGINTNTSPPNQSTKSAYTFNTESNSRFRAIFEDPETEFVQKAEKHSFLNQFSNKDGITNACHRKKILDNIDRQKLKDETFHLSQVLQLSTSSLAMSDDVLRKNCDATVERFYKYSGKLKNVITTNTSFEFLYF